MAALTIPNADCLYIALSLKSAKRLLWRALKKLNKDFELGATFNNSELVMSFPNGSIITLGGADNAEAIEKYRGTPHHLVIIDECKSFSAALLDELIVEVLEPRLLDYRGTLVLIGTPGDVLAGQFFEITGPESTQVAETPAGRTVKSIPYEDRSEDRFVGAAWEWSLHTWTQADNVAAPQIWEEACREKTRKGWTDDNPIWRREYLGEWQPDTGKRVYAFNSALHTWTPGPSTADNPFGLPESHSEWEYVIGIDLGYKDAFALEVLAYSATERRRYHVKEIREKRLNVTKMASAIKDTVALCGEVQAMVADYAGTGDAILDEFSDIHGLFVDRAEKLQKRDFIELWNDEITGGNYKILKGSKLAEELANNQWDERNPLKEKPSLERDCADAALYASREVRRLHSFAPPVSVPEPGSNEAYRLEAEAAQAKAIARRQKQKSGEWEETPYQSDVEDSNAFEWDI